MISASMGGGKSAGKGQGTEKAVAINNLNFKGDSNSGPPSPHCIFPEQFFMFFINCVDNGWYGVAKFDCFRLS